MESSTSQTLNDHLHYPTLEDGEPLVNPKSEEPLTQSDKLYVGNLPSEISLVDLHKAFKRYGHISDIQLPYNTGPGGKPKGYAFILYTNNEDAAKAQLKMDGTLLKKRVIRVDFAHQDIKSNLLFKSRKASKESGQVTTLSIMKGGHHGRNTQEQISLAEAKLRELSSDKRSNPTATSLPLHPSLPPKPPSTLPIRPNSANSTPALTPKSSLPSLPLPPQSKPPSVNSVHKKPPPSSSSFSSSAPSGSFIKKTPKLSGVKLIKKSKDGC